MNYPQIAAAVYQYCTGYDQFLPPLSEQTARAWAKAFEKYGLTAEELMEGVDKFYAENSRRPLPFDLVREARAVRQEKRDRQTDHSDYEAICDSKVMSDEEALRFIQRRTQQSIPGKGLVS